MKLPLKLSRNIARLLMALALFAQGVITPGAYAAAAVPAHASSATGHAAAARGMPCHAKPGGACLVHCSQADQASLDHAQLAALPVSIAVWHAATPPAPNVPYPAWVQGEPRPGASPNLPILYCSLLN